MTALKAHEVERFLQNPTLDRGVYLIYGPDQGLVREIGQRLIRHYSGKNPDPMSEITFESSDLISDPSRLAVEARTSSMFGDTRRIRVRAATKSLTPTLSELLDDMPEAIIILEAGNLPPRDSLRALAERQKSALALPCYADTNETLSTLIRQNFAEAGIEISPDTITTIRDNLGNDREVTRRELEKLTLYASESKILSQEDVILLCGDNASLAIDEILDSASSGRAENLDISVSRALNSGIDVQRLLISALMHFTWLRQLRVEIDKGRGARDVLDSQRPRPHFSRKASLEQQLRLWSDEALSAAIMRIYDAIAQSRKSATLSRSIAQRALLAICVAAAHR